jgi:hypothetical protein
MKGHTLTLAALLVLAPSASIMARTTQVTRPVFVASVEQNSARLVWHTQEATPSIVEYGPTQQYGQVWRSKGMQQIHEVDLLRLDPGKRYFYRIRTDQEVLYEGAEYHFDTVPDKSTTRARFLVWGDSGTGDADQLSLVPHMLAAEADFMLHTGDVVYPDGEAEDYLAKYFLPYADFLRNTPVFPSLGNHDLHTDNGQPYLDAFYLPENNPLGNERYYSFNWGQAHFVSLDSNLNLPSLELNWLREDLQAATTRWKIVFFHHPPYSCGMHGSDSNVRAELAPLLQELDVDVVFSGHEHDYERTYPLVDGAAVDTHQDPNYVDTSGVVYIVTGGGSTARPTSDACDYTSVARAATHFTQVDIDGNRLTIRAIDNNGSVLDTWTLQKGGAESTTQTIRGTARLLSNVPNPFNPVTLLRYEMLSGHDVHLSIYDLRGRMVTTLSSGYRAAGTYQVSWSGRNHRGERMPSGLYLARLQVGDQHLTRKILLAK